MDVAVVYESMFGNTRTVAEAIAEGLRGSDPGAQVALLAVGEATADKIENVALLVVGAPTHVGRMPTSRTRKQFLPGPGVREWLEALAVVPPGRHGAAFDTRFSYPLAGSAARPISRQLERHGYEVVAKPTGFFVQQSKGPLKIEEAERARAWGATLLGR